MGEKYNLISAAEESLARRIALGIIVKRRVNYWLQLIPGMFIFDFLRRTGEIRRFSRDYLFPRKLALNVAAQTAAEEERREALSRAEETIGTWLGGRNLHSETVHQAQMAVVELLVDHYSRLLGVEGDTYPELVRNAYGDWVTYNNFLKKYDSLEAELSQAVIEARGDDEALKEKILAERRQAEEFRRKDRNAIF